MATVEAFSYTEHYLPKTSEMLFSNHLLSNESIFFTTFLTTFFNFSYYLCGCPFRVIFVRRISTKAIPNENEFQAKSLWLQKSCCGVFTMLSSFWIIRDIRLAFPNSDQPSKPSLYFDMARKILFSISKITILQLFWFQKDAIVKIINHLHLNRQFLGKRIINGDKKKELFIRIFATVICSLYTVTIALDCISARVVMNHSGCLPNKFHWNGHCWWRDMIQGGYDNFFLGHFNFTDYEMELTSSDLIIGILSAGGFLHRQFLRSYFDLSLLIASLTFWLSAKVFAISLTQTSELAIIRRNTNHGWIKVRKQFEALSDLATLINKVYGSIFASFLLVVILDYSIRFESDFQKLSTAEWNVIGNLVIYFSGVVAVLLFAADACHQVNT